MNESNCLFCQIARGEVPAQVIYEDDHYLAFLDIKPFCEGHTLVIPKKHFHWVWEIDDIGAYFEVVKKIANHFKKVFDTSFVPAVVWGMEVPHAHVHLMPNAAGRLYLRWPKGKLDDTKTKLLLERMKLR